MNILQIKQCYCFKTNESSVAQITKDHFNRLLGTGSATYQPTERAKLDPTLFIFVLLKFW